MKTSIKELYDLFPIEIAEATLTDLKEFELETGMIPITNREELEAYLSERKGRGLI